MSIFIQQVEASVKTDRRQDAQTAAGVTVRPWALKALPVASIAVALSWAALTVDRARPWEAAPAAKAVAAQAHDIRVCEELFDEWLARRGNDGDGSGPAETAFEHCLSGRIEGGIQQLHRMLDPERAQTASKSL